MNRIDARSLHPHHHLSGARLKVRHLLQPHHLRITHLVNANHLHSFLLSMRPASRRSTLPLWPYSLPVMVAHNATMEGNVFPSHADVAALDFTILDEPSGDKLCRSNPRRNPARDRRCVPEDAD